jgi:hypothetical protein
MQFQGTVIRIHLDLALSRTRNREGQVSTGSGSTVGRAVLRVIPTFSFTSMRAGLDLGKVLRDGHCRFPSAEASCYVPDGDRFRVRGRPAWPGPTRLLRNTEGLQSRDEGRDGDSVTW